jgi:hypothetical protein
MAAEIESVKENETENLVGAMAEIVTLFVMHMILDGLATNVEENVVAREEVEDEEMTFEATHEAKTDAMAADLETMPAESAPVMVMGLTAEVMKRDREDRCIP